MIITQQIALSSELGSDKIKSYCTVTIILSRTTEFGECNIGLEIFQVAAQNLHDPNTVLHCSAAAPIVVAAYIAGDLTLNLGKPLLGRKL